jgi:hypothetical protein
MASTIGFYFCNSNRKFGYRQASSLFLIQEYHANQGGTFIQRESWGWNFVIKRYKNL